MATLLVVDAPGMVKSHAAVTANAASSSVQRTNVGLE
jgi:hypothetical protein